MLTAPFSLGIQIVLYFIVNFMHMSSAFPAPWVYTLKSGLSQELVPSATWTEHQWEMLHLFNTGRKKKKFWDPATINHTKATNYLLIMSQLQNKYNQKYLINSFVFIHSKHALLQFPKVNADSFWKLPLICRGLKTSSILYPLLKQINLQLPRCSEVTCKSG